MKKIFLLVTALLLCCLVGCDNKEREPVSIYLDPSFMSSAYEVDSDINLDGASIKLIYSDGTTRTIRCEREFLKGFDTATTGTKEVYALYKGVESNRLSYQVYNPESVLKVVESKTRLTLTKVVSDGKTILTFSLRNVDIRVRALSFTLTSSDALSDTLSDLNGVATGAMTDFYWNKTSPTALTCVLYAPSPMQSDGYVFTIEWVADDVDVTVSDITVSDGLKDYYLPRVQ